MVNIVKLKIIIMRSKGNVIEVRDSRKSEVIPDSVDWSIPDSHNNIAVWSIKIPQIILALIINRRRELIINQFVQHIKFFQ